VTVISMSGKPHAQSEVQAGIYSGFTVAFPHFPFGD
jgi:hypothetical protein